MFSNFLAEPDEPGKPELKDWSKDHAKIKWTPPKSDGGAPITEYIIEKKEVPGTKWHKVATVPGDTHDATINGLTEGQKYHFRVKAVNKAGPGKPSEASDLLLAKDRFGNFHIYIFVFKNSVFTNI